MTNPADREFLNAILRQDFTAFVRKSINTLSPGQTFIPEWHIRAIAYQLERSAVVTSHVLLSICHRGP